MLATALVASGVAAVAVGVTVEFGWTWTAMLVGACLAAAGLYVEVGD